MSEKKFLQKGKKSLRFSRVVPARGPAGWAGGRAGGQVRGGGGGTEAALPWPCPPPLPTAHPPAQTPALDRASRALRPEGGEKGGRRGTTWEQWGRGPEGMPCLRGTLPSREGDLGHRGKKRVGEPGVRYRKFQEFFHLYFPFSVSFFFFFLLTVSVSLSQATVDLFVCLRLSHLLETSHFHEVGMKRLEGRLAGGLRGREGAPGVS